MSTKDRIKLLKRIAQANPVPEVIAGEPRAVDISIFPTVILGWGTNNTAFIQELVTLINRTLHFLSNGETDFDKMRQVNFNVDPKSKYHGSLQGIASLAKDVYNKILTNGSAAYKEALTADKKEEIINLIKTSSSFGLIQDGSISSALAAKGIGSFKQEILSIFQRIK